MKAAVATAALKRPCGPRWKSRTSWSRAGLPAGPASAARSVVSGAAVADGERHPDLGARVRGRLHGRLAEARIERVRGRLRSEGRRPGHGRHLAEERGERAVRASLDRRNPDPGRCSRPGDQLLPARLPLRPDVPGERRPHARDGRVAHLGRAAGDARGGGSLGHRRDADVEPVRARIRCDDRIAPAKHLLAKQLGDVGFADAVGSERADLAPVPEAASAQPRENPVAPHRPHLAGRAGQEDDDAPVGTIDPPAGRGAVGVRDRDCRRDEPGLLEVDLRERDAAPVEQSPEPSLEPRVDDRGLADRGGDGLPGQVIGCRPEAAGRDDQVDRGEALAKRPGDQAEIVRQGDDPADADAVLAEGAGKLAAIRVAGLAGRQLAPDREQLRGRDAARRRVRTGARHSRNGTRTGPSAHSCGRRDTSPSAPRSRVPWFDLTLDVTYPR